LGSTCLLFLQSVFCRDTQHLLCSVTSSLPLKSPIFLLKFLFFGLYTFLFETGATGLPNTLFAALVPAAHLKNIFFSVGPQFFEGRVSRPDVCFSLVFASVLSPAFLSIFFLLRRVPLRLEDHEFFLPIQRFFLGCFLAFCLWLSWLPVHLFSFRRRSTEDPPFSCDSLLPSPASEFPNISFFPLAATAGRGFPKLLILSLPRRTFFYPFSLLAGHGATSPL